MNKNQFYDRLISVSDGVFWTGAYESGAALQCNPYIVTASGQAVLIDGGSRSDFAAVMMKILQAEVDPKQIVALIYQHADPDLCGSLSNIVDICQNDSLKVFSNKGDTEFLKYYIHRERAHLIESIDTHDFQYTFGGRTLQFHSTPYAHSSGGYITHDLQTGTLFTSDLFGSFSFGAFSQEWELFLELPEACFSCTDYQDCKAGKLICPVLNILNFHKKVMPCGRALKNAMSVVRRLSPKMIAPQHGSIIAHQRDIVFLIDRLERLENVGVDGIPMCNEVDE